MTSFNYCGFTLPNRLFAAPMAGVTDRPFRQLCKRMGAALAVSEMVTCQSLLYGSAKTMRRADHQGEVDPIVVQIAGADPAMMAEATRYNIARGAQIIDINMGCPAKKVCNVMAGSALLQNEPLVERILTAVVAAAGEIPVTLKIRSGWDTQHKNAESILAIAERAGIRALAIHGRTRCQQYRGEAEYETIRAVKRVASIPIVANGDITNAAKAADVLAYTGADAVMIGRAAQGRPWIFREIAHYLDHGQLPPPPSLGEIAAIILGHIDELYRFYGDTLGYRVARKHIGWSTRGLKASAAFRHHMNTIEGVEAQRAAVSDYFAYLADHYDTLPEPAVTESVDELALAD